jgi:DNA-directed RNA polymerase alpha subunit
MVTEAYKQKEKIEKKEIYDLFSKLGVTQKELDKWIEEISLDIKKTESRITDLALCVLIRNGLKRKHLRRLGARLQLRRCRPKHLLEKFDYFEKYIVK